jgi:uncharacterized protein YaeQ
MNEASATTVFTEFALDTFTKHVAKCLLKSINQNHASWRNIRVVVSGTEKIEMVSKFRITDSPPNMAIGSLG